MKYLITLFAILLAIFLVKKQLRAKTKAVEPREEDASGETSRAPRQPMGAKPMVACAHCGVFFERDVALEKNGRLFCSADHMQADLGGPA